MNVMTGRGERTWIEVPRPLPQGVARGWMALEGGSAVAGVFEVIAGGAFMLTYHVLGEMKPRVDRHNTFEQAREAANKVLSTSKVIPRAMPMGIKGHA